tara:strand:+ start:7020 stop:8084 length:1065 start_codon:yes stop_codon:yes gene_type:complete
MKIKYLFVPFIILTFSSCKTQNKPLYVGTYTNGKSEGIYKLEFNTKTGVLSNKLLAVAIENPSFISFSPNRQYMYAVGEGKTSAITALKVKKDGLLEFINTQSSNGNGPCHVSLNKTGDKAVVSNYGGGTFSIYTVNKNGSLNKAYQVFDHNAENKKSHAHSAQFYKNDLFVSDLGRNGLYQYILKVDLYTLKTSSIIEMPNNPGPRHFALSKNGEFIYIINEYGNSIVSVKRTNEGFQKIDEDTTLDDNFNDKSFCADIHLSKDERFVYGSNRGENSITVFKRNTKTGTLEKIQNIAVHGDWPRNFTLDPTGKFLLVANQKSDNISVFKRDINTGKLDFLNTTDLPSPVCLLF